jgi:hypothetical protein
MARNDKNNGGTLGFEAELFRAADKLRGNMEPSDYKHVALGLIFLKYISDAFEARHKALMAEDPAAAEDKDEYLAENIFWVPREARWSHLKANAKQPTIGSFIDEAMRAIEKDNESLKSVLPKDYARPALNKVMLGELIDLISGIALGEEENRSKDILGRVYEYFLGQFAGAEGKRGGEFYTPRSVDSNPTGAASTTLAAAPAACSCSRKSLPRSTAADSATSPSTGRRAPVPAEFGYPPDLQDAAVQMVLQQAEVLTAVWSASCG